MDGHRKDLQGMIQDEKTGELFVDEMKYIPTRRLCVDIMQMSHRRRTNDG